MIGDARSDRVEFVYLAPYEENVQPDLTPEQRKRILKILDDLE